MVSPHARVGSINVLLTTQVGPAIQGLNAFSRSVERTGAVVSKRVQGIDQTISSLNRSLGGMNVRGMTSLTLSALRARSVLDQLRNIALAAGVAIGGLMPAAVAANIIRTVDAAHRMTNQLRTVTKDTYDLRATQQALFEVAQRTRSSFESTAIIYARTARATEHLGLTQQKLLRITETVQKAFAVGGATAAEAQGAAIQLSQGIASNRFSGEEFRSVAENAPVLLMGMADALGVNIGKLREMAHAGELTADVVTRAILAASEKIDAAFEKTASTVEQAWTRVGNAILKYAMDSEKASAGQQILVGGLNKLAENISALVDGVMALGAVWAAVFTARRIRSITDLIGGMRASRQSVVELAQANLKLAEAQKAAARGEFIRQRAAFNKALNEGTLTTKQLQRQQLQLAAASASYKGAAAAATAATKQLAEAQKAASFLGMSASVATRAFAGALALLGGPLGAALTAITVTMTAFSIRAGNAQDRIMKLRDELHALGIKSEDAAGELGTVTKELDKMTEDEKRQRLRRLADELERVMGARSFWSHFAASEEDKKNLQFLEDQIRDIIFLAEDLNLTPVETEALQQMDRLIQKLREGKTPVEVLQRELDKIGEADLRKPIDDLIGALRESIAWVGSLRKGLDQVASAMDEVETGKSGRIPGGRMAELQREMNERIAFQSRHGWMDLFPDLFKKEKQERAPRKTADDRFEESVQSIYARIAALRLERETMNASYYEQVRREEALKLEQEALKQAREEARRKGEVDWENAQISEEKRKKIEEVAEALAREADATKRAREEMEFTRDVLNDVFGGLRGALQDGKLGWEELGDVAIRVLDRIISKIQDELINAILSAMKFGGGSGGIFSSLFSLGGGGPITGYQSAIQSGSVVGFFHEGGDAGKPRQVRTVPLVNPATLPKFHSGRAGIGHKEVMALLEKNESIFTAGQTNRIAGALAANVGALKAGPQRVELVVSAEEGELFRPVIRSESQGVTVTMLKEYNRARKKHYEAGARHG